MSSAHPPAGKIAILVSVVVSFVIQGCAIFLSSSVKAVQVEEADQLAISLDRARSLRPGNGAELVVSVFGEPADRQRSCVLDGIVWRYPIRAWNDMAKRPEVVPAVRLRTSFDGSGILIDWGFVDSLNGRPLAVRETTDDVYRWFQALSQAPPPIPPCINLNKTLIRGQTTQQEVERALGQWHPDLYCGNGGPVPLVNKTITASGSVWDWYVDRPSPLFVPPYYLVAAFDKQGSLIGWHFEATYPGGRK